MKTLTTLLILLSSLFIMLFPNAFTKSNAAEEKLEFNYINTTLTLSGTVTAGHPDLSWNSVSGADHYILNRLPITGTGYSENSFQVSTTSFIDTGVGAVAQSGGICQIRYSVSAYDVNETLIATSNPIDFITTPDNVAILTGKCYDPI